MNNLTKILIALFIACFVNISVGQNLVPNPSFEDTISCPSLLAELSKTTFWSTPTQGSADYFHICSSGSVNIPNNTFGHQHAHSGSAYIGIAVYDLDSTYSYREYIQVQLQQPLTSGQKYWVTLYASLGDTVDYAIQELGAYFSASQINDNSMDSTLMFNPQIEYSEGIIADENGWSKISGSFTASGTENYLLIGNFNRSQTTTSSQVSSTNTDYSYYYIDDVCVSSDSLVCANPVGVMDYEHGINLFKIFPNPAKDYITVVNIFDNKPYKITIYNSLGQVIYNEENITKNTKTIDISSFDSNLLFIKINSLNQSFIHKLLKP